MTMTGGRPGCDMYTGSRSTIGAVRQQQMPVLLVLNCSQPALTAVLTAVLIVVSSQTTGQTIQWCLYIVLYAQKPQRRRQANMQTTVLLLYSTYKVKTDIPHLPLPLHHHHHKRWMQRYTLHTLHPPRHQPHDALHAAATIRWQARTGQAGHGVAHGSGSQ